MRTGGYMIGQAKRILRPTLKPPPLRADQLHYDFSFVRDMSLST